MKPLLRTMLLVAFLAALLPSTAAQTEPAKAPAFNGVVAKGASSPVFLNQYPEIYGYPGEKFTFDIYGRGITYRIERAKGTEWTPVAEGATLDDGKDVTSVPYTYRDSVGVNPKFRYTVALPDRSWSYTSEPQTFRSVVPPFIPTGAAARDIRLIMTNDVTRPARWNPCRSIQVKVDFRRQSRTSKARALKDVKEALRYMKAKTGFTFVYAGQTKANGSSSYETAAAIPSRTVVLTWAPIKAGSAGSGMPAFSTRVLPNAHFSSLDRGKIVINPKHDRSHRDRQRVIRHEMGHVLGADHLKDSRNLMGIFGNRQATMGTMDAYWIRAVGSRAGCY